jgi:hypothetical protein
MGIFLNPMEAIVTDLLGFIPIHPHNHQDPSSSSHFIMCFCGNFGVLLLNPSWLSIDGGRTALDILEKMVNATMMRGMCLRCRVGDVESGVSSPPPSCRRRPAATKRRRCTSPVQRQARQVETTSTTVSGLELILLRVG